MKTLLLFLSIALIVVPSSARASISDDIKAMRAQIAADKIELKDTEQSLIPAKLKVKQIDTMMFVGEASKVRHLQMAKREVEVLESKKSGLQDEIAELEDQILTLHEACPACEEMQLLFPGTGSSIKKAKISDKAKKQLDERTTDSSVPQGGNTVRGAD